MSSTAFSKVATLLFSFFIVIGCSSTKNTSSNSSSRADQASSNGIKPFSKVITSEAKTDDGLFNVHWVSEKLYYEIPDSL
ncbi:MAG: DUF5118 domain-containing protein, partial [Balneolaceae bacterium]